MKVRIGKFFKNGHRNIKVEIEKFDTWNLDTTLAFIILPALVQLRDSKMGVPAEFVDIGGASYDVQESFDFYKDSHDEHFDKSVERWNDVLDKMIWSFEQLVLNDYEQKYHYGQPKYDWVKTPSQQLNPINNLMEDMYQMVDTNPDEHWYDIEGHSEHERRIQEGLELFGKYYKHLWD